MDNATEFNIDMEEKVYKSNKISLELMRLNRGIEIDHSLRYGSMIDSLRAGSAVIYVPIKNDPIDIRLADFINDHLQRGLLR